MSKDYSKYTEYQLFEELQYLNSEILRKQAVLAHYSNLYKSLLFQYNLAVSNRIEEGECGPILKSPENDNGETL